MSPDENGASREMPKYQSHKRVWALKIAAIEFEDGGDARISPSDAGFATFSVADYRNKFKGNESDLGYHVVYDDGYNSWSPTKAFEDGYTRIDGKPFQLSGRQAEEEIDKLKRELR